MKIGNKITLSFFLTGLLLAGTATAIAYLIVEDTLKKDICTHLCTVVYLKAKQVDTYLKEEQQAVAQLSQNIYLREFLSTGKKGPGRGDRFDRVMESLRKIEGSRECIYEMLLLDQDGKVGASSNADRIGLDRSSDEYFLEGKTGVHIKSPYFSKTTGQKSMAISSPVTDENNEKMLGVVVAKINLDMLNEMLVDRTGLGETGETFLVDTNDYVITPLKHVKQSFLDMRVDTAGIRKKIRNGKKFDSVTEPCLPAKGVDYRGVKVWSIKAEIPRTGWTLVAKFDEEEAILPIVKIRNLIIVIFLLVPAAAGAIGMYVSRVVSDPIRRLHEGTERIGKGHLDHKVATPAKDEIGQLSRAFDKMTSDLKKVTASKDALDREIEDRRKAEAAVRESEQRLQTILGKVLTGIVVIDAETHEIVDVNSAAVELIGLPRDKIIGEVCNDFICPAEKGKCPVSDLKRTIDATECVLLNAGGGSVPILKTVIPATIGGKEYLVESFLDISERKKAEKELRDSRERLKIMFEYAPDAYYLNDLQGVFVDGNIAAEKLTGYKKEELIGKSMMSAKLLSLDQIPKAATLLAQSALGKATGPDEFVVTRKDGERVFLEMRTFPVEIQGRTLVLGIARDITERKKMEKEIRDLAKFPSEDPNPVIRVAKDGRILYSNNAGQVVLDKWKSGVGGVISRTWAGLIEESFEKKCAVCEEKMDEEIEGRTFSFSIVPVIDAGYVNLYARDITGRRKAEQILKESELRYRTLFETSGEGILVIDIETKKFRYANPAICKMLGYTEEELRQIGTEDIHPKEVMKRVISDLEAQARGSRVLTEDIPCLRKDGKTIYVDISAVQAVINGKECNIGFFTDITERKKIHEAILETEKLASIGAIIVEITHEINNPLQIVTGSAQLALMRQYEGEKIKETLETIVDQGLRTKDIVDRLLKFASPGTGTREEVDINKSIDGILALMEYRYAQVGVKIKKRYDPSLPFLRVDEKQIQEVVLNLANNALDAMPKGGEISVATSKENDNIKIEITDTGTGMPEGVIKRLFEPFFTTKEKGTGMGLSVCYGIVKAHKGEITVKSAPGKGTTVVVLLPIIT